MIPSGGVFRKKQFVMTENTVAEGLRLYVDGFVNSMFSFLLRMSYNHLLCISAE